MIEMTGRVLLLGEVNPYGATPEFALYCYPPGCAGARLQRFLGLSEQQYLSLRRMNLCEGAWSRKAAEARASELLVPLSPHPVIVMLGRKVTDAVRRAAMIEGDLGPFSTTDCCPGLTLVSLPHPSGRNATAWTPQARARTRQILGALVPELPWGSADEAVEAA